jgi:hypothetical protein
LLQILHAAFTDQVNANFTAAILALTALALIGGRLQDGPLARLSQHAPATLTAIGVLGTFFGILIGLLAFDVNDISASVPRLLDGMKTAFVTSVVGTGCGIAVKLINEVIGRPAQAAEARGVEDVIASLTELRAEAAKSREETLLGLDRIRIALTGDAESSLVTQLQRLRTDVTDEIKSGRRANSEHMAAITAEIRTISTTLAESTSKAFIQALEIAIRDFNQKISEQFGENFKQLNIAVGRLLEWQEAYRQQMIANAEALREGVEGIQAVRGGVEAIGAQAGAMVQAAGDMAALLEGLGKTRAEMDARLAAFQQMATAATTAMPMIQAQLEALTTSFAREVEQTTKSATAIGEAAREAQAKQKNMLEELGKGYDRLREDAAKVGGDLREGAARAGEELRITLAKAVEEVQRVSGDSIRTVGETLRRTVDTEFDRIAKGLEGQVKQVDEAMTKELEKALESMGTNLVSLTGKFVDDYRLVTNSLRDAAETVRRP